MLSKYQYNTHIEVLYGTDIFSSKGGAVLTRTVLYGTVLTNTAVYFQLFLYWQMEVARWTYTLGFLACVLGLAARQPDK